MHRRATAPLPIVAAFLAGALFTAVPTPAAEPAKPASGCVACHTDVAKLQEEAKGIPIPTGSALQAGKG
jgi:hypothetical protein